tara:strand:- start:1081 stop:1755 length:675 start_codon:yes stop_codon:yes gene_type:complete
MSKMLQNNDIDIFLFREDLLNIFNELIVQIGNEEQFHKISLSLINKFKKNNINPITIIDEISALEILNNKLVVNNYLLIIGEKNYVVNKYLDSHYINYEYIETPLSFLELLNKCKKFINQINHSIKERILLKDFSYSFQLNSIYTDKNSLYLTDKENEIFKFLINNLNSTFNKKQLLSHVWKYNEDIDTHTLETHIYTLRKKIKEKLNLSNLIIHEEDGYRINQ